MYIYVPIHVYICTLCILLFFISKVYVDVVSCVGYLSVYAVLNYVCKYSLNKLYLCYVIDLFQQSQRQWLQLYISTKLTTSNVTYDLIPVSTYTYYLRTRIILFEKHHIGKILTFFRKYLFGSI